MGVMDLKDVDLNLLVVLHQLLLQRRVSRAAELLGLTQPAVSNALARLRNLLGDELFVRASAGMVPTPYANQLAGPVAEALGILHRAVNQQRSFDAATSTRRFVIAMSDIGEIYFLPRLIQEIARIAPGISVSTVHNATLGLKDEMEAGHVDLAVGLLPQLAAGFVHRRLFRQRYVCTFRKGHALDKGKITLREFCAAEHLVVISAGTGHGKADELMERAGVTRDVKLRVPHFIAVGHLLRDSDLVATLPERLAQSVAAPFGLAYVGHPAKLPEISIDVFWHARHHRDPASQWLRAVIVRLFGAARAR
ncbi:MAG TPA: LysR family transcriptional regulator [Kofleriaceae bacterium]|nr:LysR family transcriptional regulator [Kofleriaceae bacterium]